MYFHSYRKGYEGNDYEQPESDKIAISSATNISVSMFEQGVSKKHLRPRSSENNKNPKIHFFSKYCQVSGTMVCQKTERKKTEKH